MISKPRSDSKMYQLSKEVINQVDDMLSNENKKTIELPMVFTINYIISYPFNILARLGCLNFLSAFASI